jgi:hypothetical protein
LEGSINALYGDFRNLNAPAAVLEIEFFLHNEDTANPGIVLQKALYEVGCDQHPISRRIGQRLERRAE